MADGAMYPRVLFLGASVVSFALLMGDAALAQTADTQEIARPSERKKQAKRKPANPSAEQQASAPVLNAYAQVGRTPVQSLDTITVAASKTEERAIDALAPVSVVTLEQIQGLQPKRLADIFYNVPGVSFQDRGDDPATAINIRGLQDFGRVAVVVDGARQNYQRSGHNANGSFFLDPELIGGVDVVRGPTANIYGSGAIGGVVSFRTKDINDVVRPGERWGVDMTGSYGSNNSRGLGSIFGGVRANPNVDIFGGAVYRTQGNYKDGDGTEIGNTGNELAGGLLKLTARPGEGHEVKLGGVFQDYKYSIGQPNRGADHHGGAAGGDRGHLGLCVGRQELHGDAELEILQAGRPLVRLERKRLRQPDRERSGQDLQQPHHHGRWHLHARQSRQQHLGLRRRPPRLCDRHNRHRRQQHHALQARRLAQCRHLRLRRVPGSGQHVRQSRQFQHHDAGRPARGYRRLRAVEAELLHLARSGQRGPL